MRACRWVDFLFEIDYSYAMITKVENFIRDNHMLKSDDTVVAGISGGADSVCLLFVLLKIRERIPFQLLAVHINHKIRKEAEEDAAYVETLCRQWNCPYYYIEENVEEYARVQHISTEEAGRIVRYGAFADVLAGAGAPDGKIAVAHNQNDNAETVLFHLFRGTGIAGLSGIRAVRGNIIRPLLCATREEIEEFLGKNQIAYCIDKTNSEDTYTRNRIRHHIVSYAQKEICERAVSHIYETSIIAGEAETFIRESAGKALSGCAKYLQREIILDVAVFMREDPFLQKQMLLLAMEDVVGSRKNITAVHVSMLLQMFYRDGNASVQLPGGMAVYREYDKVRLTCGETVERADDQGDKKQLVIPGVTWYQGMAFEASLLSCEKSQIIPVKTYTKWFDYDKIIKSLMLRTRQTGDYLQAYANGGKKSLKAYYIEEKIPRAQRDHIPVLADGDHILWVVGQRISEYYKVDKETKTVLQIQVTGGTTDGGKDQSTVDRERS